MNIFFCLIPIHTQEGIGKGGPIDGYDISVYHVVTDFKLGSTVDGKDTRENIWPVCLPKNDGDYSGMKDGFIAGWPDNPPVSQQNPFLLGPVSTTFEGLK